MNWTGFPLLAVVLTALGCGCGLYCYAWLDGSMGVSAPWAIAVCAAIPAALSSREPSVMRGLTVATLVVWAAAAAHGVYGYGLGIIEALMSFHEKLDLYLFVQFAIAAAVATVIGSRALRPAATADAR